MNYPFKFRWTKKHEEFCLDNKIFLNNDMLIKGVYERRNMILRRRGTLITIENDIFVERYSRMPNGGFCSVGKHSYSFSKLPNNTIIGRFCSIAENVSIMGAQHPTQRFTSSPITYEKQFINIAEEEYGFNYTIAPFNGKAGAVTIGNDVWIGKGVVLKGGITIGHGAIIATNAVVTKDIPPYAIVAGVPARVIKYRFSPENIAHLLKFEWWNYRFIDVPNSCDNIDEFICKLHELIINDSIEKESTQKINISTSFNTLLK